MKALKNIDAMNKLKNSNHKDELKQFLGQEPLHTTLFNNPNKFTTESKKIRIKEKTVRLPKLNLLRRFKMQKLDMSKISEEGSDYTYSESASGRDDK